MAEATCSNCKVGRGYRPFLDYVVLCPKHLAARDQAEDLFDHRFKEAVLDCKHCEGIGWRREDAMEVYKCGKCQDGEIYVELCIRCKLDSNHCECKVADFTHD